MRLALRWAPAAGFKSCSCMPTSVAPLVLLIRARAPDLVAAALRTQIGLALDRDQEVDGFEHSPDRGVVRELPRLVHASKAQRDDGGLDLGQRADGALSQRRLDRFRFGHFGSPVASALPLAFGLSARR